MTMGGTELAANCGFSHAVSFHATLNCTTMWLQQASTIHNTMCQSQTLVFTINEQIIYSQYNNNYRCNRLRCPLARLWGIYSILVIGEWPVFFLVKLELAIFKNDTCE